MAPKRKRSNSTASASEPELEFSDQDPEVKEEGESSGSEPQLEAPEFTISLKAPRQYRSKKSKPKFEYQPDLADKLIIQPQAKWDKLAQYVSFVHAGTTFRPGEIIEVKRPGGDGTPGNRKEWIAKVLQIKASSASHVYVRIAWFYWPEDLPMGRQEYHGRNEAIESNHPDIIDALTVNGKADIKEWDEEDEDASFDGYYYRQQFDYLSKQLTTPIQVCVCEGHYNPDTRIIHCPGCKIWMHEECITADAVRRHQKSSVISKLGDTLKSGLDAILPEKKDKKDKKSQHPSKKSIGGLDQNIAAVVFEGKLRIKEGIKKCDNDSDSGLDPDTIIDEDIRCLKCGEVVP